MEDMKKERESAKWVMKVIAISSVLVCVLVGGLMFFIIRGSVYGRLAFYDINKEFEFI